MAKKKIIVSIYFGKEDLGIIDRKAEVLGLRRSPYCRMIILNEIRKEE